MPAYRIESTVVQKIEAEHRYNHRFTGLKAKEWLLCVAQPPELPGQTNLKISMEPAARVVNEGSTLARPILVLQLPARNPGLEQGFEVKVKYQAVLRARQLVARKADEQVVPVAPLPARELKACLAPGTTIDYKSADFQKWLDGQNLRRGAGEDVIDFAKRAFVGIGRNLAYQFQPGQDHRVSRLCTAKGTDCAGFSWLFVAVMRANNIPARGLAGRWATSSKPGDSMFATMHVKAEFFAPGIGWVPVDPSRAASGGKAEPALRFFGVDAGDLLVMHVDPDLIVDTVWFGKKSVELMQTVTFWATGSGSMDKGVSQDSWQVNKVP
jgi:transglutaminase-like putative cysteine protease